MDEHFRDLRKSAAGFGLIEFSKWLRIEHSYVIKGVMTKSITRSRS